jgi:glycosyltransferase involved in cell wall biosynthesis
LLRDKYNQPSILVVNGVDFKKFSGGSPVYWTPPSDTFDILCIGRSALWKGFEDLCSALRIIVSKNVKVRLVVATQDNLYFPPDLPIYIAKPKDDIALGVLYRTCSIFVCSSWFEGFGLPPLEAMGNGLPVVTTNCGGINDFAIDKTNCLIVPRQCPDQLAEAILKLYDNRLFAKKLAINGLETSKNFTMDNSIKNLEKILKRLSMND